MVAVGLPGVFKYGAKFLGYLVAVVAAAGVLVVGGGVLAATGGLNLAAPSLASLATGSAIAGAVLALLGVFVGLSGLFGLAHKLLADAASVAVASATGTEAASTADAETDAETPEEEESTEDDRSAVAAEAGETPLDGDDDTGSVTDEPATDRPVDGATAQAPSESSADDPETPTERPGVTPGSVADDSDRPTADGAASSPPRTDVESHPHADEFVDEPSSADDWTDSKYATGTQPEGIPEEAAPSADVEDDVSADDAVTDARDQDRAEWTPPDPAEFEQSTDPTDETPPGETSPNDPPTEGTARTTDDRDVSRNDTDSQSDDAVRTWDDVQSASSGTGIETEQETTDVGQSGGVREDTTAATDLAEGDGDTPDPFAQDEPNFAEPEPDEAGDDAPAADEGADDDDDDEDLTLADEGVASFEADGDDDPLGDRLSGGD